jgi:type I restriction enzyme S subunit
MASERRETIYCEIAADFAEDRLRDLCDPEAGIQTGPFGSQLHQKDYVPLGTPIITVENLGENRILHDGVARVSDADRDRLSRYLLQTGDIVFSRVGSVDRRALVRRAEDGWMFSGRCLRVRPDPERIDSGYLSYFFGLPAFREHIRAIAVGATMPSLNTSLLSDVVIPHPRDIDEQRAIAHILGTLDDKIELNRRMNETLEQIARALFKSWFVDFDPVRAKSEGRDPGLPSEIADLFPNSFEESELGAIPTGWRVATLGELSMKPQYGFTASARDEPVGPKFLRITDINKRPWIEWASVPHCEISDEEYRRYRVDSGDVVIARMADPGHGVMIEEDVDAVFASYLIRFRPKDAIFARFLQYWLRSDDYWDLVGARYAGTTRASLNAQVLSAFQLVRPSERVVQVFSTTIGALRSKVISNVLESENLADLRNALLPKLISGELRVKCAERLLEA